MSTNFYASKTLDQILKEFNVTRFGLKKDEVEKRKQLFGLNQLRSEQVYWWHILLRQFTSPFLYLLIGAGVLAFILGEHIDAIMIIVFVMINALLGFYQEYRSEQTLKLLRSYIQYETKVIRNGEEIEIQSTEIVPGDIVCFEAGDIIPADIYLIDSEDLSIDESVLTGESAPVSKDLSNNKLCFSGTTVESGRGKGIVLKTGKNTSMGEIAKLTTDTHRESSYEKGIAKFSKFILYLVVLTLVGIFIVNILIKGSAVDLPNLLIFSIALAVSVIPEALPIVITFSLSRGALQLAKNKVIVKRLSAIEDLGSIEVLCTDKTGTLTENQLTVKNIFKKEENVLLYAALASTVIEKRNHSVHSFDIAIEKALTQKELKEFESYMQVDELPFDPIRKRSSMLVQKHKDSTLIVKGAVEEIVALCSNISASDKERIHEWMQAESGNRLIAVAKKKIAHTIKELKEEEHALDLVGLISFVDPIRRSAYQAVKRAEKLGIKIKILTGDSREVAAAVAYEIRLIENKNKVITGEEFDALSSHEQHKAVYEYDVFARVSPQQKYHIIQLLQEKHEVGFLGEGINDAPALKIANVAIVVSGATDVAREAADIILLQKSLRVIVDGIKDGRETFANTSKYIKATLSSNFGNFYTVAISSLFITFLPLLPLQLLLINLLTDFPMIAVAADSVDTNELKSPRSYDIKEIALIGTLLGVVSTVFDFIFFALFFKISPQVLQTNWFMGSVITELLFLLSIRTHKPFWKASRPAGILMVLTAIAFITGIYLPFTEVGHTIFSFITPSSDHIYMIIAIACSYLISTEGVKLLYYRYIKPIR